MRAEAVGQHRQIERGEVLPELRVVEVVVDAQVDTPGIGGRAQQLGELVVVARPGRLEDVAVPVDLEHGSRQTVDRLEQRADDGNGVHVRPQALEMEADAVGVVVVASPVALAVESGALDAAHGLEIDHVRMRQHDGATSPSTLDLVGGAVGQGDHGVGGGNEHVQLGVMLCPVTVVRVAEVVHRVHERLALSSQLGHEFAEFSGRSRIEAELQMEDVELVGVLAHPVGVEHDRGPPPLLGRTAGVVGMGIGQPHDAHAAIAGCCSRSAGCGDIAVDRRDVPHVDMGCGNGCDPHELRLGARTDRRDSSCR